VNPKVGNPQQHSHPAPNLRWAVRIIRINRLWLAAAVMLAISVTIMTHLQEKSSFVSSAILSLDTHDQKNIFGGVPGLTTGDNFIPRTFTIMEQFKNPETCGLMVKVVSKAIDKKRMDVPVFNAHPEGVCGSLSFQPDPDKLQLRIVSRTEDPHLSQFAAAAAGHLLIETDQKRLRRKISEMKGFLSTQEQDLGVQLKKIESEKATFQADNAIITGAPAESQITQRLEQAEQEYLENQVQLKNNEGMLQQSKNRMDELKAFLAKGESSVSSFLLSQVQYRLNMLQYRKSTLKAEMDPEAVKKIDTEISEIMKVYQSAIEGKGESDLSIGGDPIEYMKTLKSSSDALLADRDKLRSKAKALEGSMEKKSLELKGLAGSLRRLGELNRDHEIASGLFSVVKKRLQEIEIDEAGAVSDFSILSRAHIGYPETVPLRKKVLFASMIALFACLVVIGLKESMIPSIKDLTDLEALGVQSLGYVPEVQMHSDGTMPVLLDDHPESLEADSIRALRLKLSGFKSLMVNKGSALVVLVTGPRPNTGKTFISSNLAVAFARSQMKTLLIDLDLRNPSVADALPGSVLQGHLGTCDIKDVSEAIEHHSQDLDVLLTKEPIEYAAEFIEKMNVSALLETLRPKYDVIVLDTPPVLSVIDLILITGSVDLKLLVVEHRKTHREDVLSAIDQLSKNSKAPILGVINKAQPEIVFSDHGRYYKVISSKNRRAS